MKTDTLISTSIRFKDPRMRIMEAILNIFECSVLDPLDSYQVCLNVAGYILANHFQGDLKSQVEASLETIFLCAEKTRELNKQESSDGKMH